MNYLVILFSLITITTFAQIKFEPGYFIDINDKRTECLIRNDDWLRNPTSIKYKTSESAELITIDVSVLKEFSVSNSRYICPTIKIDTSSQDVKYLTDSRAPRWATKHVALKTLVTGKADLYYYDDGKLRLFFFTVDGAPIEQLEYKSYTYIDPLEPNLVRIVKNINYINQLQTRVVCGGEATKFATSKMPYNEKFLTDYFLRYNKCSGGEEASAQSDSKEKRDRFHLRLSPGIDFSAARIDNVFAGLENDYPARESSFRMGIELEFILPFNKNKWAIVVEPTYQAYKSTSPMVIEYSSIEIPVGLRHRFFLSEDVRVFLNIAGVFDFPIEYRAKLKSGLFIESDTKTLCFAGGLGLEYKRFGLEGRYYATRSGSDNTEIYSCDFTKIGVILGYRLF